VFLTDHVNCEFTDGRRRQHMWLLAQLAQFSLRFLSEHAYLTFGVFAVANTSLVCLSVMFVRPTQGVEIFGNSFCHFVLQ